MAEPLFTTEVALTARQAHALAVITEHQPIRSEDLGARLHAWRHLSQGTGHPADEYCDWCTSAGREVGEALHRRGVVRYVLRKGWMLAREMSQDRVTSSQLRDGDPWPEGF